jgi:hypothetical protein
MTSYLGPVPYELNIYATKGILWRKYIEFPVNGVPIDLADHTFSGFFCKKAGTAPFYSFTFEKETTRCLWKLTPEISGTVPIGCSDSDPANRFSYHVLVTTNVVPEFVLFSGVLVIAPRSTP